MNVTAFQEIDQKIARPTRRTDRGRYRGHHGRLRQVALLNDERGYYTGATHMVVRPASTEVSKSCGFATRPGPPSCPRAAIPAYVVAQPHMSVAGKSCCR